MASFNHINGEESSTITFKLATVTQTRNSSVMHQEIMALGDPDTSNAIAAVLAGTPASTAWGLVTRAAVRDSTVFQGTSPWVIAGNSTVAPLAGSTWATRPIQSSAADLQMTATQGTNPWTIAGNSTVAPLAGSTWATRPIQSSAADLQMTATPAAGSTWRTQPGSTLWASSAGFHFDSSGALNVNSGASASSTDVTAKQGVGNSSGADAWPTATVDSSNAIVKPGDSANNAIRVNIIAGAGTGGTALADQAAFSSAVTSLTPVGGVVGLGDVVSGKAGAFRMSSNRALWTFPVDSSGGTITDSTQRAIRVTSVDAGGSTVVTVSRFDPGLVSSGVAAGNSSALTVRNVWSSTNADQPVSAAQSGTWNIGTVTAVTAVSSVGGVVSIQGNSTAVIQGNSTAFQGGTWTVNLGTHIQSSAAPSSNSSGVVVRQVIDAIATFASTSALATTSVSVVSSGAALRAYVTAYSITSTNQTPAQWGFWSSNGTLLWPLTLAALSSGVAGANLAVAAPGYLFRTAASEALNFKTQGSTVSLVQMAVSYFIAP